MSCKIRGYEVVSKIIEGSDGRVIVKVRPGDRLIRVKRGIGVDRKKCSQKSCKDGRGKRQRSAGVS